MVYILQKLNELLHRCRQDKTREQKQGKNSTSQRENHFKYNAQSLKLILIATGSLIPENSSTPSIHHLTRTHQLKPSPRTTKWHATVLTYLANGLCLRFKVQAPLPFFPPSLIRRMPVSCFSCYSFSKYTWLGNSH